MFQPKDQAKGEKSSTDIVADIHSLEIQAS